MSQPTMRKYPAAFKERAVKLAVESDQPLAQTARDLGVNENTLHTWIGKYHRTECQAKEVHDEHLYEELKHLRGFHVRRDKLPSIAYSEELISFAMSTSLQSTDRHHGIVGQEHCHFQRDS